MNNEIIPHNQPSLGYEEQIAAMDVIRSGWLAQGKQVEKFENEICDFFGLPNGHAVAVSSGTAALFLALWSLGAKGKKVAFPSYVCSALRNATLMAGGKEVLIDSGRENPNIELENLVYSNANIGIIPHMFGIPQVLSDRMGNMSLIEDCAQALGAKINNTYVGLQGDVGVLSFYATKVITSGGQGGMVISKNKDLIDNIKDFRHFDEIRDKELRFNFQMTDLHAAIGRVQLRKLPEFLNRREEIFQQYRKAGINLLDTTDSKVQPIRYRAVMETERQKEILEALGKEKIKAVIPVLTKEIRIQSEQLLNALNWTKKTISLPIFPSLTNEQMNRIISIVLRH